jgi:hypothetical protein
LTLTFAAALLLPAVCLADAAVEGTNPAQWRLIWKSDPSTEATLSWSTAKPGEKHRVYVKGESDEMHRMVEAHRNGRYTDDGEGIELYYHHVKLTELQPATRYRVVIESDEARSPEMYFLTAPDRDVPMSLIFGGDSRSDQQARRQVNQLMARLMDQRPVILGVAHGGDYIVDGRKLSQWSDWMSDHELTVGRDSRLLPIIPTRGNHDGGPLFNEIFDFPPDDKNYFALNLGPEIRLITLNTETSTGGDQAQWLESELQESRPENRWLLAQYHRPAYPAVKEPGTALQHWVPLFEEYNLDMACEADGHNIKRTPPIRDNKVDPTGVTYIGEGGFGVKQRSPDMSRWFLQPPGKAGQGHHVQLLDFHPDRLEYRVILLSGRVFDEHVLPVRTETASVR